MTIWNVAHSAAKAGHHFPLGTLTPVAVKLSTELREISQCLEKTPTGPFVEHPFSTLSLTHCTSLKIFVGILPLNVAPFVHHVSRSGRMMMNMAVLVSTHIPTLNVIWKVFQPS